MSRVMLALLGIAGCSPAFYAAPADVVGATIESKLADPGIIVRLSPADAKKVYTALKAGEVKVLAESALWETSYILTFETREGDRIATRLEYGLRLWTPSGGKGDREVPEVARTVLLRYVRPNTD